MKNNELQSDVITTPQILCPRCGSLSSMCTIRCDCGFLLRPFALLNAIIVVCALVVAAFCVGYCIGYLF